MNVKIICLAILHDQDTTGYEIRKRSTEGEYSLFVEASYGSIYPALARLEAESLVTSRVEPQEGRPAKKVYSITENGRAAFRMSLFEDLGEDVFRSGFMLFARFAHTLPASLVVKRLNERLESFDHRIKMIEDLDVDDASQSDKWVIDYGLSCLRIARSHLQHHMQELIDVAQPDDDAKAAE